MTGLLGLGAALAGAKPPTAPAKARNRARAGRKVPWLPDSVVAAILGRHER